jgi:integrase
VLSEWEAAGRLLLPRADDGKPNDLTINELLIAYWRHAKEYYGLGRRGRRGHDLKDALRVVRDLYAETLARDFGPLALKACRLKMLARDWSRSYINSQCGKLKRMFRWAAEEELLPGSVYVNLTAVAGFRRGKCDARETKKVRPVPQEHVDVALPFMRPVVQAMVHFQELTGCRPTEACIIRPIDIDTRGSVWLYRPEGHKTEHHGHDRIILIGPKAQEVLRPYLGTKVDAYCFSPARSEAERSVVRRENRKTPLTPSQRKRRRKPKRLRAPGDRYDTITYRQAIRRACEKAHVTPWGPNRLRHNRATELRAHGLDVAKTILGHEKVETTQVYAEKDLAAAIEVVAKTG